MDVVILVKDNRIVKLVNIYELNESEVGDALSITENIT